MAFNQVMFGQGRFNEPLPLWIQANFDKLRQRPDEDRTFAAFGRFIASFALVESGLHIAAKFFSEMPDAKARTVFNGARTTDVIKCLRQFVAGTAIAHDIDELIQQLLFITDARNQFVHQLIEYSHRRGLSVTNRLTSDVASQEPRIFTLEELDNMSHDCRLIFGRLILHCNKPEELKSLRDFPLAAIGEPWRYKPTSPKNTPLPNRDAHKSRKRRPPASRESPPDQS